MCEKVHLDVFQLRELYRESFVVRGNRLIFTQPRSFQEYLGVYESSDGSKVIRKGKNISVGINLPVDLPKTEPKQLNWMEIALARGEEVANPLSCRAKHLGFFPGRFRAESPFSELFVEDIPRLTEVNYALFIYCGVDYSVFVNSVENFIGKRTHVGVLISKEIMGQSMMLVPLDLLIGGREYICDLWNKLYPPEIVKPRF